MKSKPFELPKPGTIGGASAKTRPSLIWLKAIMARPATADADRLADLRLSNGFNLTKAMPTFCPQPLKPKPAAVSTPSTASFSLVR